MLRVVVRTFLVCLHFCFVTPAQALPPRRVSLHYTRGEQAQACIDPLQLTRKVEAYTGPVLVAPGSADAAVEVHIDVRAGLGFRARIQLTREDGSAPGERILEHADSDCRTFDGALAFVIATAIDPDLVLEGVSTLFAAEATLPPHSLLDEVSRAPKRPEKQAQARVETKEVVAPPTNVVPPESKLPKARWSIALGTTLSTELPEVALGLSLALRRVVLRWLEVGAHARANLALMNSFVGAYYAESSAFAGGLSSCPRLPLGVDRAVLAICAGAEVALLRASGGGFANDKSDSLVGFAGLLRPEASLRVFGPYSFVAAGFVRLGTRYRIRYGAGPQTETFYTSSLLSTGAEIAVRRAF